MNAIEISGLKKQFPKSGFLLDLPRLAVQEGYITVFIGEKERLRYSELRRELTDVTDAAWPPP